MKPSDIKPNTTYRNRGDGRTHRHVIKISTDIKPQWFGSLLSRPPNEPGVMFRIVGGARDGQLKTLYLSSFAAWAGGTVENTQEPTN